MIIYTHTYSFKTYVIQPITKSLQLVLFFFPLYHVNVKDKFKQFDPKSSRSLIGPQVPSFIKPTSPALRPKRLLDSRILTGDKYWNGMEWES